MIMLHIWMARFVLYREKGIIDKWVNVLSKDSVVQFETK